MLILYSYLNVVTAKRNTITSVHYKMHKLVRLDNKKTKQKSHLFPLQKNTSFM